MTLISVCIPAYNRASLLSVLLDSVLNQDFYDFEIVIAEDCSPERQAIRSMAFKYQQQYGDRIRYTENIETLGYDGNLRRLVELALGQYVLFMGNDDLMAPGALSAVAAAVHEFSNVGVVLRSYSSFVSDPNFPIQVFRYFDEDRVFPAGAETVVTFFRRSVFISGMVFNRASALTYATTYFDGSLLYQQHLVGNILRYQSGVYLNQILAYHRLGGVPDFGVSISEKGLFTPKQQTPESSLQFMRGMLAIAYSLDDLNGEKVGRRILHDIGNYAYPILSVQAGRPYGIFLVYLYQLLRLGFWRVPLFHIYWLGLLMLGRRNCDSLIAMIKKKKGRAPLLGHVYNGEARSDRSN